MSLDPVAHEIHVTLSHAELAVCAELMAAVRLTQVVDLLRLGLWHVAHHLDVPMPPGLFGLPIPPPAASEPTTDYLPLFDEASA